MVGLGWGEGVGVSLLGIEFRASYVLGRKLTVKPYHITVKSLSLMNSRQVFY